MKKLIEKVLGTEVVFQGNFLKVWRDQVELSNGHRSVREYIKHPGAALIIPMLNENEVLMIHQYRHAVGKVFLEFPAGKCDPGESTAKTAARELQEEVGYRSDQLTFLTRIHPVIGYSNEHIDLYLAQNLEPAPMERDIDEILELETVTLEQLQKKIWNQEISDVKTQIAAFWLFRHLSTRGE